MNHGGDFRTAPATPGLLNIGKNNKQKIPGEYFLLVILKPSIPPPQEKGEETQIQQQI